MDGGLGYADNPAHVVATSGDHHIDRDVAVQLVYRAGTWRFTATAMDMPG